MDIKKAKLVIWDLDETFWKGTLSEGDVTPIPLNIEIVRTLVDRGIMNSIVSKNDYNKVESVLKAWGIFELFIFPKVSWQPKGEVVKNLLNEIKLRPENAVFIDDNTSNIGEVKFYNDGICAVLPDEIQCILTHPAFDGKDDKTHSRLKQYHLMEERNQAESKFSSNEEFLRSSHIKIQICENCLAEEERIFELVQRTNQLNYTKNRCSYDDLHKMLQDPSYECRYIKASDDFGDYGIVGFYALFKNNLDHFLFSCRTIGFGIENFIYQKLNKPSIDIVGDVTTPIDNEKIIDWIEIETNSNRRAVPKKEDLQILMIAGCDLEQAAAYIESKFSIDKEFATVVNGAEIRTSDTCNLVNSLLLDDEEKDNLNKNLSFIDSSITFGTKCFNKHYDVIILSVVDDYIRTLYTHKTKKYNIVCGPLAFYNIFEHKDLLPESTWAYLEQNFNHVGRVPAEIFIKNMNIILSNIPSSTKVLLINGPEIDVSEWIGKELVERNIEMNKAVDSIVSAYENVHLLDMRNIVLDKNVCVKKDNRHFNRSIYYQMAQSIVTFCEQSFIVPKENLTIRNQKIVDITNYFKKMLKNVLSKLK